MAKMNKKTFQKNILKQQINSYERKIVVAKEFIPVLKLDYQKMIDKKLSKLARKHRKILLPLEINAISRKEYHQVIIDDLMKKHDEKLYWKKRALAQKKLNQTNEAKLDVLKINQDYDIAIKQLDEIRSQYYNKLLLKYPLEDSEEKIYSENLKKYTERKKELDLEYEKFKTNLDEKYKNFLSKKVEINDKLIVDLKEKLKVKYAKVEVIFEEEKNQLIERKKVLLDELQNNSNNDEVRKELDEIESLFKMYDENDDTILKVKNLTMKFGGLKAIDNLSFDVKKGEIFGLIGPNGAGKTTVFNCITQFYKPTSGKIYYEYRDQIIDLNSIKVHDIIKQGIVRTFQNVELIWELTILDNLLVAGHTLFKSGFFTQLLHLPKLGKEEEVIKAKAIRVLEYLDLLMYKDIPPIGLPYGILKRIELARTFMTDPKLIILDEPAAGLNDTETLELASIIKKIRDDFGTTIFLVEHDMGLVMDVCDTICAISFGKKLALGTPEEIQMNEKVQEAYLGGE
ncbi:MAG: ATP-binding cassette domain-containing protein [Acholeplasma sp.]|nr:ATP-binding cassette domain-containing protein [Acholeplasma sp.]